MRAFAIFLVLLLAALTFALPAKESSELSAGHFMGDGHNHGSDFRVKHHPLDGHEHEPGFKFD